MPESTYLLDNFASVLPGEPFRLFPFGQLVKGGIKHMLTPDIARKFRLPHFKPPIKLGNHDDTSPAGGFITSLEVRDDGLYAIPEYNERGKTAVAEGHYRYQSPEVIWEGGGYEDPNTGDPISGPLIVGAAFLHTPHLGDAAALYSVQPMEVTNMENVETVQVPKSFWDAFVMKLFPPKPAEVEPVPAPVIEPDKFAALKNERDEFKAKLDQLEASRLQAERVEKFTAVLKDTKVSDGAPVLASMTDEQAEWVLGHFKALSAQVKDSVLLAEFGSETAAPTDPQQVLTAAITQRMTNAKVDYVAAVGMIAREQPDLLRNAGYK